MAEKSGQEVAATSARPPLIVGVSGASGVVMACRAI